MARKLQNPFEDFDTECKFLNYVEMERQTYIPPQEIIVGKNVNTGTDITMQFIPIRKVLRKFFELPGVFDSVMEYFAELEKEHILISNIVQSQMWKEKKQPFGDEVVLPIFLYQDDFGTNNPLGGRQAEGKVGAVDIVVACLPAHLQSKVDNIFHVALYQTKDLKVVPLANMFTRVVQELTFLESHGILITTSRGEINVRFVLTKLTGDNLAVNTLLGFSRGFTAQFPCRFCLTRTTDMKSVFHESQCKLRTKDNYLQDLDKVDMSLTGIGAESVLNDFEFVSTIDLMTVDVMHDLLEGVIQYDLGLVLHNFIDERYFTLEQLNHRLIEFDYGVNEKRNKPPPVKQHQIRDDFIKMSASETSCLLRNIGVLIGHWVPKDNKYWKIIILLKEILDIVTSLVSHDGITDYLSVLISAYLSSLVSLVPGYLKPKHHFLVHYPRLIKILGPLWPMNTIRNESGNRDSKIAAVASLNRQNICKTIAIKLQLKLSHRLELNESVYKLHYECKSSQSITLQELASFDLLYKSISKDCCEKLRRLNAIVFQNRTITESIVLYLPNVEGFQIFEIKHLLQNENEQLFIIVKEITDILFYDEHFQAFYADDQETAYIDFEWRCFTISDLKHCLVSHFVLSGNKKKYVVKRWI